MIRRVLSAGSEVQGDRLPKIECCPRLSVKSRR